MNTKHPPSEVWHLYCVNERRILPEHDSEERDHVARAGMAHTKETGHGVWLRKKVSA